MVAIKIVRSVKKYSDAAMIEIDVLQKLARNDAAGKHCVQIRNWFDYRSHICIVSIWLIYRIFPNLSSRHWGQINQ
jgi:dual-specificity kinase